MIEGFIDAFDGIKIYYQYNEVENAKGTVVFSHGFVEYSAHYSRLGKMFNQQGYNLFKYDVRGHGKTTAPLGELNHFEDFADDLSRCVEWVKDQDSTLPVFTMGFSLGGMITAVYGLMNPFGTQGQILLGAGLEPQPQFMSLQENHIGIHQFLDMMGTQGDGGIKQLVAMDSPYVLKQASKQFLQEALFKAQQFIWESIGSYNHSVLILHGRKDPIVDVVGSEKFYEAISSIDKEIVIFEDYQHDLLRIRDAHVIVDQISAWCDARL